MTPTKLRIKPQAPTVRERFEWPPPVRRRPADLDVFDDAQWPDEEPVVGFFIGLTLIGAIVIGVLLGISLAIGADRLWTWL